MSEFIRGENDRWVEAEPLGYTGWKAKTADWCRKVGLYPIARILEWWDERGLA